jgi:hypothetical protein
VTERTSQSDILDSYSARSRRLTPEKPYRKYRAILRDGFRAAFGEHGIEPSNEDIERIAASPTTMGPHPEVPEALRIERAL